MLFSILTLAAAITVGAAAATQSNVSHTYPLATALTTVAPLDRNFASSRGLSFAFETQYVPNGLWRNVSWTVEADFCGSRR